LNTIIAFVTYHHVADVVKRDAGRMMEFARQSTLGAKLAQKITLIIKNLVTQSRTQKNNKAQESSQQIALLTSTQAHKHTSTHEHTIT
jgi:hypothetical protein